MTVAVQTPQLANDPTLVGFTAWVYTFMGVPESALPPDSIFLQLAYDESVNITYTGLKLVKNRSQPYTPPQYVAPPIYPAIPKVRVQSPSIYAIAVYNLAGHFLVNTAMDLPNARPPTAPPDYWADLRKTMGLNNFSYGIINSAADQGTSAGQMIPDYIKEMTLFNMWLLQTPWGRMYMMIAGQWGTVWGIS